MRSDRGASHAFEREIPAVAPAPCDSAALERLADSRAAAESAGLRYSSDDEPGISRRRCGRGFTYFRPDGRKLSDAAALARIRRLAIPPAWQDVWISPHARGHLSATGRDARGRKQYRYNAEFLQIRDSAKYEHIIEFARQLPAVRERVARDMALPGLAREKVLATIVHLLETTQSRIGNESYAKDNNSFGLTTLRNRHVRVRGTELKFLFRGKSGKIWNFSVESARVAKIIRACQDLPGQHLFEYREPEGEIRKIDSADVNAYLQEVAGPYVSAKDFRTWAGTVEVAMALHGCARRNRTSSRRDIVEAIKRAAHRLGNTVAICRKCYVHPQILSAYENGKFRLSMRRHRKREAGCFALNAEESAVLAFLEKRSRR